MKQKIKKGLKNINRKRSSKEISNSGLSLPKDLLTTSNRTNILLYLYIQLFLRNGESRPSLRTLCQTSKLSINTVRNSIKDLSINNFIEVDKTSNISKYSFIEKDHNLFINYQLLINEKLNEIEKYYIIAISMYLDKHNSIKLSNKEISNLINLSESTISKCNRSLEDKNYLKQEDVNDSAIK